MNRIKKWQNHSSSYHVNHVNPVYSLTVSARAALSVLKRRGGGDA
jgi:hypothetical protein